MSLTSSQPAPRLAAEPVLEPASANLLGGFAHPHYARSLREFGEPLNLPGSGGSLLVRPIGGEGLRDAMGPYPIFCCPHWDALAGDLRGLRSSLVSVVLVADPFGPSRRELEGTFDRVIPFKTHYVADLSRPLTEIVRRSHRDTVRRARRKVSVSVCSEPTELVATWMAMYAALVTRRGISGVRAFSRQALAEHLTIPGLTAFVARVDHEIVGLDLWFQQGDVVQGYLAACSETGYRFRAMYAMKWAMLEHFRGRAAWVNLGGGAGLRDAEDGLSRFKSGWATDTRTAYLCAAILQPEVYADLMRAARADGSTYLPAYRAGEFS